MKEPAVLASRVAPFPAAALGVAATILHGPKADRLQRGRDGADRR